MTYPDLKAYPLATSRFVCPECKIVKDRFWKMVDENRTKAQILLSNRLICPTKVPLQSTTLPSGTIGKVMVCFITLDPILRMWIERAEVF